MAHKTKEMKIFIFGQLILICNHIKMHNTGKQGELNFKRSSELIGNVPYSDQMRLLSIKSGLIKQLFPLALTVEVD